MSDDIEERIIKMFPKGTSKIVVNLKTLEIFKGIIEKQMKFPAKVKPIRRFSWEEYYLSGQGDDKEEYEKLKRIRPTSHEIYSLSKIDDFIDIDHGLFGRLTRLKDKKRFQMPLLDFEFMDKDKIGNNLLDDYQCWFVNYK
jgi:hypothetical protein